MTPRPLSFMLWPKREEAEIPRPGSIWKARFLMTGISFLNTYLGDSGRFYYIERKEFGFNMLWQAGGILCLCLGRWSGPLDWPNLNRVLFLIDRQPFPPFGDFGKVVTISCRI